ncbi:MAG TPA: nuclear transport factor 2 family protein, partial [Acidimicrobiia bacterium]|nr:nuclear transport factor 2 family protein [Acidimicrobiia bacterium]
MELSNLEQAINRSHQAVDAFVTGDPTPLGMLYSRRDDSTLANPFGPPARGWKNIAETMDRAAAGFREGEAIGFDRISQVSTSDLGYVVEIERFRSKLGGADEFTEFALRVTTILRLEEGDWKIVHRHADPITTPRS